VRLFLHVARRALAAFVGSLAAVVVIFLVVDFAEHAGSFRGPGWVTAVALLYANRAAQVAYQTAPAAMLLAAALTASGLRRTSEYTAMRSLGLGPWRVALPVAAVGLAVAAGTAWLGDAVALEAGGRGDEILATRFGSGVAGWQRYQSRKSWFRGAGGRRIYQLRGAAEGGGFERVTVLELTAAFGLGRRIDADRMAPGARPGEWLLRGVSERRFEGDRVVLESAVERSYDFGDGAEAFAVRPGRPAQMRAAVLEEQIGLRRGLGLPVGEFLLEWHQRGAWPLAALAAGLPALALALRRSRRGHFTAALMESVGVSLAFWLVQGICTSLGMTGRLPPAAAAWLADGIFLVLGALALRRLA